jgi:hypothetical protein
VIRAFVPLGRAPNGGSARLLAVGGASQQSRYGLLDGRLFCIFIHRHPWGECPLLPSTLGDADPELAALLATFSRLASGEQMPLHEKVRSALRNPPHRRRPRPRRGKALSRRLGPPRAAVLIWLLASVTLITVAVILSRGGDPASCPQAWGICGG